MEDYERNDGSKEKPYFMSDSLKGILKVKNRFEGTDDAALQMEAVKSSTEHPGSGGNSQEIGGQLVKASSSQVMLGSTALYRVKF